MARAGSKKLLSGIKEYLPDRWEVSRLKWWNVPDGVRGTVKIHCLEDDMLFLSDFAASLDPSGRVCDLSLDGLPVDKFVRGQHARLPSGTSTPE